MPTDTTVAADTPAYLPVAIAGHQYLVDLDGFSRDTIPPVRTQADTSTEPGEQSLTPQGLWRRSQESFHHGAGQPFLDGRQGLSAYSLVNADPHRFRTSKGLDPWTKGQMSLLHPTLNTWSTTNTNLYLAVAYATPSGPFFLYVSDGNELYSNPLPYSGFNTLALQNGTGWTATNATITALGTMFKLTATAAAAVSATSPTGVAGVPVDPGRVYGVGFSSLYVSGGAAKTPQVSVTWYTAAGATISTTTPAVSSFTDAGPNGSSATYPFTGVTAPATAAFASVTIAYTTNWANGEIHQILSTNIGPFTDLTTNSWPFNWSTVDIHAGQAAQTVNSITTDGTHVWAALGTSGIHRNLGGATVSTADVPAPLGANHFCHLVGYANGRLLAAGSPAAGPVGQRNVLYEIGDPMGTPDWYGATGTTVPLMTHPNPSFAWTFISPGRNCIYAGGNSGGNAEVYRITMETVSTALGAPTHCTYLPDGETIHALTFYAGGIVMGTGRGLRLGQADGQGNIDYGPLVPTTWPVRCLEPQDRYCWFGWTKYDATSSGLGRADLGFFTDTLTPAWASDLMAAGTTSGDVLSAVTFAPYGYTLTQRPPVRVFTVAGKGVYIEDPASLVASGQFETGSIRFSTSETKQTRAVDVRHHALAGTVTTELKNDNGAYASIGSSSVATSSGTTLATAAAEGEAAELRYTLTRTAALTGPELTRWTLKALPLPHLDEAFTLPIIMNESVVTDQGDGADVTTNVAAEIAFLKGLERTRTVVTFQVGAETLTGYIDGSQQKGDNWGRDGAFLAGTYVVRLVTCE